MPFHFGLGGGDGNSPIDPNTVPIINVTAEGRYLLWDGVPDGVDNNAPYYFAAARCQVDNLANRRFYLATDSGNVVVDDNIEIGFTSPGYAVFRLGINQFYPTTGIVAATTPNVCEITGFVSHTGIVILAALNTLNTHHSVNRFYWVTDDTTFPPPTPTYTTSGARAYSPHSNLTHEWASVAFMNGYQAGIDLRKVSGWGQLSRVLYASAQVHGPGWAMIGGDALVVVDSTGTELALGAPCDGVDIWRMGY